MKTRSLCLVFIAMHALASVVGSAATTKYIIGDGGSLGWNHFTGDACGCPWDTGGCKIEVTQNSIRVIDLGESWHVSGFAVTGLFDITSPELYQQNFSTTNYTYASGFFEVDAGELPNIPAGTRINLAGVTTDATGYFSAVVPK